MCIYSIAQMLKMSPFLKIWVADIKTYIMFCIFLLNVDKAAPQTCNASERNITATTTELLTFTSPGYDGGAGTYISNMDCWWVIDAGADDLKLLIFMTYDLSCPGDKVYIYDGDSNGDPALANGLCGSPSAPAQYSTTQRYARIVMKTDGSAEKAGFSIDVVAAKDYCTGCTSTQTIVATDDFQFLSGPNFPGKYSSDSNCRWAITSANGNLDIEVLVSDIEDDDPTACDYDKYMIYDGPNRCDHNNVKMVCSEYPKIKSYNFTSTESTVTVTLESDSSVNRRGFLMRFKAAEVTTTDSITTTTTVNSTTDTSSSLSDTSSKTKGLEMNLELLLGIVFGSLILISFTIITVVLVVKKVQAPVLKTITPVQPYRPRPNIQTSLRTRRSNETGNRGNSTGNGTKQQSIGSRVISQRTISVW